ncbi:MAG: EamA family transporter [Clostridia bacterium]|nr:EamA family transporter [Clostridia bacterium]
MTYLALAVTMLFLTGQNIVKEQYNKKCKGGTYFFTSVCALFAMLFFASANRVWHLDPVFLLPAGGFALSYAVATIGSLLAIKHGELATTSLILSYSLLIPTFYGLIFLGDEVSPFLVIGLILVAISLFLTNYKKQDKQAEKKKFSWVWLLFLVLGFLGNGMCTVVQKAAQNTYGNESIYLIMLLALGLVSGSMLIFSFATKERAFRGEPLKKGWYLALGCGVMNGAVNLLVIFLNPRLAPSVLYPLLSAGSLIFVFLYSRFLLKEKFTPMQYVGFFAGVASVVFLNL